VNPQKLNQTVAMYHSKRMTVKEIQEATGISAATLYQSLKEEQTQESDQSLLCFFLY
jgi:hypothetical protein